MARRGGFQLFRLLGGRRSRSSDEGCGYVLLVLGAGGLVLMVLYWLAMAVVALFMTPIPYVAMAVAATVYGARELHKQRVEKRYFDAVAALGGVGGDPTATFEALWRSSQREPDVQLLGAGYFASHGSYDQAQSCLQLLSSGADRVGGLSGGLGLWLPGQVEPIWFGPGPALTANTVLASAYIQVLAGRAADALPRLGSRLHEPHYGAALFAIAEACTQIGDHHRAAAMLQQYVGRVADARARHALRYRLVTALESVGADHEALLQLRVLLAEGGGDSVVNKTAEIAARVEAQRKSIEHQAEQQRRAVARDQQQRQPNQPGKHWLELGEPRQDSEEDAEERRQQWHREAERLQQRRDIEKRALAERDEAAFQAASANIAAARGPKTRDRALATGLSSLTQPYMKERLLLEASRIEVQVVLDKVAGLKTKKAKERNLAEALARIEADEVPDALQAGEIALLRQALNELEAT